MEDQRLTQLSEFGGLANRGLVAIYNSQNRSWQLHFRGCEPCTAAWITPPEDPAPRPSPQSELAWQSELENNLTRRFALKALSLSLVSIGSVEKFILKNSNGNSRRRKVIFPAFAMDRAPSRGPAQDFVAGRWRGRIRA